MASARTGVVLPRMSPLAGTPSPIPRALADLLALDALIANVVPRTDDEALTEYGTIEPPLRDDELDDINEALLELPANRFSFAPGWKPRGSELLADAATVAGTYGERLREALDLLAPERLEPGANEQFLPRAEAYLSAYLAVYMQAAPTVAPWLLFDRAGSLTPQLAVLLVEMFVLWTSDMNEAVRALLAHPSRLVTLRSMLAPERPAFPLRTATLVAAARTPGPAFGVLVRGARQARLLDVTGLDTADATEDAVAADEEASRAESFARGVLTIAATYNRAEEAAWALRKGVMLERWAQRDFVRLLSERQAYDVVRVLVDTGLASRVFYSDYGSENDGNNDETILAILASTQPALSRSESAFARMRGLTAFRAPYQDVSLDEPSVLGRRLRVAYGTLALRIWDSFSIRSYYQRAFGNDFPAVTPNFSNLTTSLEDVFSAEDDGLWLDYGSAMELGRFYVSGMRNEAGDEEDYAGDEAADYTLEFFPADHAQFMYDLVTAQATPGVTYGQGLVTLARGEMSFGDLLRDEDTEEAEAHGHVAFLAAVDEYVRNVVGPLEHYASLRAPLPAPALPVVRPAPAQPLTIVGGGAFERRYARPMLATVRATLAVGVSEFEASASVQLPGYVLDELVGTDVPTPYTFELRSPRTGRATHVGVLDFSRLVDAVVPERVLTALGVQRDELLELLAVTLPAGTGVTLRPATPLAAAFMAESRPAAETLLTAAFARYAVASVGDRVAIFARGTVYEMLVTGVEPPHAGGVRTRDVDLELNLDVTSPKRRRHAEAIRSGTLVRELPPAFLEASAYARRAALLGGLQTSVRFASWYTVSNEQRRGARDVLLIDALAARSFIRRRACDVCLAPLHERANLVNGLGLALADRTEEEPFALAAFAEHVPEDDAVGAEYALGDERRDATRYLTTEGGGGGEDAPDVRHLECTLYQALFAFVGGQEQQQQQQQQQSPESPLAFEAVPEDWLWSMLVRISSTASNRDFVRRLFATLERMSSHSPWALHSSRLLRGRLGTPSSNATLQALRQTVAGLM